MNMTHTQSKNPSSYTRNGLCTDVRMYALWILRVDGKDREREGMSVLTYRTRAMKH